MQRKSILTVFSISRLLLPVFLLLALLLPAAPAQALAQVKIIVHYIEGVFVPEKAAYQVQVYLSVMDSAGKPLKNLAASNFTVSEDSQKFDVAGVTVATQPVSIVFLLDNSLSMANSMDSARLAVRNFVKALSPGDQVALVTFNEKINREIEFTGDIEQVRGAQNDIIFPKDTPVSRQHAVIECKGGQFFLSEVCVPDDTGALKSPRYGTFVNEKPLQLAPLQLRSGSIIRLGPRVKLEFRLPHRPEDDLTMDSEDATLDGFDDATKDGSPAPKNANPADQDKTQADN